MVSQKIWDPVVRLTHWAAAVGILVNSLTLDAEDPRHIWVGLGVLLVVGLRLLWGCVGPHYARFESFPADGEAALAQLGDIVEGRRTGYVGHSPLGALMIYNLWSSILLICVTGMMVQSSMYGGQAWIAELHEVLASWVVFSAALHVGCVILESRRTRVNLSKSMVTGRKDRAKQKGRKF